jgi:tetratricopeptide (TPR) repeat protein
MRWLLLMMLFSAAARAEETPKELYERATAAFALQNYEEAATLYEKAFSIKPDPALLYNAAQAHRMGGNKVRALKLYQNYIKLYGSRIPNRAEVEKHILTLKAAIASDERSASAPPTEPHPVATEGMGRREPEKQAEKPPEAVVTTTTTTPPPPDKPVYKKGWFWGVVVGAVVVDGVGVGLGVGLGMPGDPKNPSPSIGSFAGN